jgi:hypothetical protein
VVAVQQHHGVRVVTRRGDHLPSTAPGAQGLTLAQLIIGLEAGTQLTRTLSVSRT